MIFTCAAGELCKKSHFPFEEGLCCAACDGKLHGSSSCSRSRRTINTTPRFEEGNDDDQICTACIQKAEKEDRAAKTKELTPEEQLKLSTDEQVGCLEVINLFNDIESISENGKKIAKNIGITEELIEWYLENFPHLRARKMDGNTDWYYDAEQREEEMEIDDNKDTTEEQKEINQRQQNNVSAIHDYNKIVAAAKQGDLYFYTWCKHDATKWRVSPMPILEDNEDNGVDRARCKYLQLLAPKWLITMVHNSIVYSKQTANQALLSQWLNGYHFSSGAYTPIFDGKKVGVKSSNPLNEAIYDNADFAKCSPKNWSEVDMMELFKGEDDPFLAKDVREMPLYHHLHPNQMRLSIEEMKRKMGDKRFNELIIQYCMQNDIPHCDEIEDIESYLKSIDGMYAILPPFLFGWREIASRGHLLIELDERCQRLKYEKEKKNSEAKENQDVADDDQDDGSKDNASDNIEEEKTSSESSSYPPFEFKNKYVELQKKYTKDKSEDEIEYEAWAEELREYVVKEILPVLKSEIEGLEADKRDHLDYIYAYSNFLVGWLNHLIKSDRSCIHYNSSRNKNGQSIDMAFITGDLMKIIGVDALGTIGTPGHEYILRMKFAVPPILRMLIQNGPLDAPISGSKCVMYSDSYRQCPTHRVDWMEFGPQFEAKYDDMIEQKRQEAREAVEAAEAAAMGSIAI